MSIRVAVAGVGVMGAHHAKIIAGAVSGAELVAVADQDRARAEAAAGATARAHTDAMALVAAEDVDALIVASPDATHHPLVMAAIAAGKPVLCEKPLAVTGDECRDIVAAERASGRQLVHVGFMRRFDPAYRALREAMSGPLGAPQLLLCQHRNESAPEWFTSDMVVTNSFVHEIDVCRWLLGGASYVAATVTPVGTGGDHLLIVLEADTGAVVSTEVAMNARYGYHVHAEAVCADGTVAMAEPALTVTRHDGACRTAYPANWIPRFDDAYRIQSQAWVDAIGAGGIDGEAASAWDGLLATLIAEQVVDALKSGRRTEIALPARP